MPKFAAPRLRQIGSIKRETSWNVKLVILRLWDRKIVILGMTTPTQDRRGAAFYGGSHPTA